jgi:hypothetical protein
MAGEIIPILKSLSRFIGRDFRGIVGTEKKIKSGLCIF